MKTTCLYCEREYETKRESSCYCSNSCRTGAYKIRKKDAQILAERQKAAMAQQELAYQQKLIDDEIRKQKAEKRRKAKEEKALLAAIENSLTNENISQDDLLSVESEIVPKQKNIEKQEENNASLRLHKKTTMKFGKKQKVDDIITVSNRKIAGLLVFGGIAYKILDYMLNPEKKY